MPLTRLIRCVSFGFAAFASVHQAVAPMAFAQTRRNLPLVAEEHVLRSSDRLDNLEMQREKLTSLRRELQEKIDKQIVERQELQSQQALVELWRKSTFALLSPRTAVGLQAESEGNIKVIATAHFPESDYIAQLVHRFNIPCLSQDDRLTESLARLPVGSLITGKGREQLSKYWCRHKYVPVNKHEAPRYVLFHDMERQASRVGLLIDLKGDTLVFQPVGNRTETIQRPRIQSGSAKAGDANRIKGEEGVDFLDLCVLQAAQLLETDENVPSFQAVSLTVKVDELEEALKLSKEMDKTWRDGWFDYLARSGEGTYVRDQRKEPARILREFSMGLEDQLRSRLNQLGIPLVEREEHEAIKAERALSKTEDFDQRNYRKLVSASHTVIAEVGRPTAGGAFRIDVRLVDVNSGNILFEDSDDIGKPVSKLASTFNVQAGNLMVMSSRTERKPAAPGTKQKPLLLETFDSRMPATRLVRLERTTDSEHIYYDLFENAPKTVAKGSTAMLPATGGAMPRDEKLRWISWQIFNSTMPAAGKVLSADDRRVTLNIGSAQGIQNGDTFRVLRLKEQGLALDGRTALAAESILPVQVRADEVSANQTSAFIVQSEVSELWNDYKIEAGDVVLRQGSRDVNVQLLPPVTDTRHWQGEVARKVNGWGANQKMRLVQKLSMFGKAFIDSTTAGLQQVGVVTSAEFDGRAPGTADTATHQVICYVSPLTGYTECSQFGLKLEVKDTQTGKLLQSIGPIQFHESEVLNWRP